MKITVHGHSPSCFGAADGLKQEAESNASAATPQGVTQVKLGFFKLKIHRKSARQKELVENIRSSETDPLPRLSSSSENAGIKSGHSSNSHSLVVSKNASDVAMAAIKAEHAATKIQAAWRGKKARKTDFNPFACRQLKEGMTIEADFEQSGFNDADKKRVGNVKCDDPLFYLMPVRLNKKIKAQLIRIDEMMRANDASGQEARTAAARLTESIKTGNWDVLGHNYMKENFGEDHSCHNMGIKRLLFYVYWKGEISRADFETGLSLLSLKEQFRGENSGAEYRDVHRPGADTFLTLPGKIEVCPYFDEEGKLTTEARQYIDRIKAGFTSDEHTGNNYYKRSEHIIKEFDEDRFILALKQVPKHLQVIFAVKDVDGSKIAGHRALSWWYREIISPFANTPSLGFEGSGKKITGSHRQNNSPQMVEVSERMSFSINSYGAEFAFQSLFTSIPTQKALVQPVSTLGSIGEEKLAAMHATSWHPVVDYDEDAKNLLHPHDMSSGPAIARMHDTHFHALMASQASIPVRNFLVDTMPQMIIRFSNPEEKELANRLMGMLADLNGEIKPSDWKILTTIIASGMARELDAVPKEGGKERKEALDKVMSFYSNVINRTCVALRNKGIPLHFQFGLFQLSLAISRYDQYGMVPVISFR